MSQTTPSAGPNRARRDRVGRAVGRTPSRAIAYVSDEHRPQWAYSTNLLDTSDPDATNDRSSNLVPAKVF